MKIRISLLIFVCFFSLSLSIAQSIPRDTIFKAINEDNIRYWESLLNYQQTTTNQSKNYVIKEVFNTLDDCDKVDLYIFMTRHKAKIPEDFYYPYSELFQNACICGKLNVVRLICDQQNRKLTMDVQDFLNACQSGNIELVQYLVKKNYPFKETDKLSRNAVMYSVKSGNLHLIKYLIEDLKIDPNELDKLNERPLSAALRLGDYKIIEYLFSKRHQDFEFEFIQELFKTVAYFNDVKSFLLLEKNLKLDPCTKDIFDRNIYHLAIRHCKIDTNFFNLLPTSPCMNDVDSLGENIAFKCTYDSVMFKYLYFKGVSYNIFNRNGNTPAAQTIHDLVSSLGDFEELTGNDLLSVQQDILGQIYCMAQKGVNANREDPIFYLFKMLPEKNRSVVLYFKSKGIALSTYTNKNGDRLLDYLRSLSKDKLIELIAQE